MNFVLSCDDNEIYYPFLKKAVELYKTLGHNVMAAYVSDNPKKEIYDLPLDRLEVVAPIDGYEIGIQAKLARGWLASQMDNDELYTLMDVDQFLIRFDWLSASIEKAHQTFDIITFGSNGFKGTDHQGKFAMSMFTTTPENYREILNVTMDGTLENVLRSFAGKQDFLDYVDWPKAWMKQRDTKNAFNDFSDESLYAFRIFEEEFDVARMDLPNFNLFKFAHRLDRSEHIMVYYNNPHFGDGFWQQDKLTEEQRKMILSGFFIDCCPARPYTNHESLIDDIVDTILELNSE
jgi:hypothetical protein